MSERLDIAECMNEIEALESRINWISKIIDALATIKYELKKKHHADIYAEHLVDISKSIEVLDFFKKEKTKCCLECSAKKSALNVEKRRMYRELSNSYYGKENEK